MSKIKMAAAAPESAAAALTAEDVNAWLDGYMPYALHTGDIAGAVVAVVKDGKITCCGASVGIPGTQPGMR